MDTDELFNITASFISDLHDYEESLTSKTKKTGLTRLQKKMIQILYFSSPRTLSSVSQCMNMNMPNTSREVKKLEKLGIILKKPSLNDKRVTELTLTTEGLELVEIDLKFMKDEFFRISGHWPDDRIKKVAESIKTFRKEIFGNPGNNEDVIQ